MDICKICGNSEGNTTVAVPEMMRKTFELFDYLECGKCGCVHIIQPPEDMSHYYDNSSYGSFKIPIRSGIKARFRATRNRHAIRNQRSLLGAVLNKFMPLPPDYTIIMDYATPDSRILDVGCGAGAYIRDLMEIGFENTSGIDPFVVDNLSYANGIKVRKKHIHEIREQYDVILSHHSFEHAPDPFRTLSAIRDNMVRDGVCLLTIPVAEELYRKYRRNCYLLQAPQHFFLYSIRSMAILAAEAGLTVERLVRDAGNAAEWIRISELWSRGVSMDDGSSAFSKTELKAFSDAQRELSAEGLGDNVTFVLRAE